MREMLVFFGLSVVVGGAASYSAGRALALRWSPLWQAAIYALLIAAIVRFLHYALFSEPLLSRERYGFDCAAALGFSLVGFKLTRRQQMDRQYGALLTRDGYTRGIRS